MKAAKRVAKLRDRLVFASPAERKAIKAKLVVAKKTLAKATAKANKHNQRVWKAHTAKVKA